MKTDKKIMKPQKKQYVALKEREEWDVHGCNNRREYRDFLNGLMWEGYTPDFAVD